MADQRTVMIGSAFSSGGGKAVVVNNGAKSAGSMAKFESLSRTYNGTNMQSDGDIFLLHNSVSFRNANFVAEEKIVITAVNVDSFPTQDKMVCSSSCRLEF